MTQRLRQLVRRVSHSSCYSFNKLSEQTQLGRLWMHFYLSTRSHLAEQPSQVVGEGGNKSTGIQVISHWMEREREREVGWVVTHKCCFASDNYHNHNSPRLALTHQHARSRAKHRHLNHSPAPQQPQPQVHSTVCQSVTRTYEHTPFTWEGGHGRN